MNKVKIINLPEITAADNTTYIPVSSGAANATRKISVNNLIGVTSPIQAQLDSKAPAENATFTGITNFEGDVQVSEDVIVDGNVRSYSNTVDTRLQFGSGAIIKIQTGVNGSTPVYREFPATELSSSDLNGSNYVMVYGVGTPTENAAELQAAYDEAKKMPRFIGYTSPTSPTYMYAGQILGVYMEGSPTYYKVLVDGEYTPYQMSGSVSVIVTEAEAKSTRTTVIVAPGEYNFGASAFTVDTEGINIVSLTGNPDVIISSTEEYYGTFVYGIIVTTNNILIKGIDCKTNTFYIASNLDNLICEYCIGGGSSFGGSGMASGIFNNCVGGDGSFGGDGGTASGAFNDCIGGDYSFGGSGMASGIFNNCVGGDGSFRGDDGTIETSARLYYTRLTSGTFPTPTGEGKIYNSIDGNGNLVNYPLLPETKTSQVVNGLTDTVDTSKDIIIYNNNDALALPSAVSMTNKRITIKNNLPNNAGSQTMEFTNSIGGTPPNRTIQRKYGCPDPTTFLVIGSVIVIGDNNTEMTVDSVDHEYITVTADIPAGITIGNVLAVDTPITIYSDDFTDGLTYKLIYAGESKDFYSNGVKWFVL